MFLNGISVGIGFLFLSLLYLNKTDQKPSKLNSLVIIIFSWLVSGPVLLAQEGLLTRLYIASIPVVFFLLLPLIYWYQQELTTYGVVKSPNKRKLHGLPVGLAGLLSLSIGLMPHDDFNNMFFSATEHQSLWVKLNSAGFALLLVAWTVLSVIYLSKIAINTKHYHQRLNAEFADHDGKRLDWLVAFTGLLVVTWLYALIVLGTSSKVSTPFISDTVLSLMVLMLIWMFCIQALNRTPVFFQSQSKPDTVADSENVYDQKYANSSINDEHLKRIASKIERKVLGEKSFLNPDIDASWLASELGISIHYLSQAFSQEMHTTFYSYINDARIEAAKKALETSEDTVLDIAFSVGYNTRSSFYNAFKKRTGMTPSRYKASSKSDSSIR